MHSFEWLKNFQIRKSPVQRASRARIRVGVSELLELRTLLSASAMLDDQGPAETQECTDEGCSVDFGFATYAQAIEVEIPMSFDGCMLGEPIGVDSDVMSNQQFDADGMLTFDTDGMPTFDTDGMLTFDFGDMPTFDFGDMPFESVDADGNMISMGWPILDGFDFGQLDGMNFDELASFAMMNFDLDALGIDWDSELFAGIGDDFEGLFDGENDGQWSGLEDWSYDICWAERSNFAGQGDLDLGQGEWTTEDWIKSAFFTGDSSEGDWNVGDWQGEDGGIVWDFGGGTDGEWSDGDFDIKPDFRGGDSQHEHGQTDDGPIDDSQDSSGNSWPEFDGEVWLAFGSVGGGSSETDPSDEPSDVVDGEFLGDPTDTSIFESTPGPTDENGTDEDTPLDDLASLNTLNDLGGEVPATGNDLLPVGAAVVQLPAGGLISLVLEGDQLVISDDGVEVERISLAQAESLAINGTSDDDSIQIDFSERVIRLASIELNLGLGDDSVTVSSLVKKLTRSFTINGEDGDDTITFGYETEGSATLNGNAGNDSLTAGGGSDSVSGGDGDDWLDGGRKRDTMRGGSGNDILFGRGGRDRLYGGDGDDFLNGNGADDTLRGNGGHDMLRGAIGDDLLIGGDGNDFMYGNEGDDTLAGNEGQDSMYGGLGNDGLSGGIGDDAIYGEMGRDTIMGGDGDDYAMGGIGKDIVMGEGGNDHVDGEQTRGDTITGGEGNDEVVGPTMEIDEDFSFFAMWADVV